MSDSDRKSPASRKDSRRGRRRRAESMEVEATPALTPVWPGMPGGRYRPLDDKDLPKFHQAILDILSRTGLSDATPSIIEKVTSAGGTLHEDGRLTFSTALVEDAIAGFARGFSLYGQATQHTMDLSGCNVHMGSGGASPSIVDLDTGLYRDSTLKDLYDAARLVDTLDNIHFFSRSLVARDMPTDQLLDINTAYACLAGTAKHVCVSACNGDNAREIARMCYSLAGSRQAFEEKPFLSFNINHVVPPLRFHEQSCDVLEQCALGGIPAHANSFGQIGASSPVHLAGSVAQSMAESIAGGIFAWLVNPAARVIFGPKPMITDLRTGGLSGGGGEQAIATAAVTQLARYYDLPCVSIAGATDRLSGGGGEQAIATAAVTQLARYYDLPCVSIAGATDSKIADAQSGYEKCLSVNLAAQAGSNLITQAAGVQASLMSVALESYVIDNDMLGGIMRSLKPLEISDDALSTEAIDSVVRSEGHFLGEADTYARMRSDFLYPDIADRRTAAEWEDDGARDIREVAIQKTRDILASHFPDHLAQADETLREQFDIRLPVEAMTGS